MGSDELCGFLGHLLHLIAVLRLLQVEKDGRHLVQDLSRKLIGGNGILERRGLLVVEYFLKFLFLLLDSCLDCRDVVGEGYLVERRYAIRGVPFRQEWILGLAACCHSHYCSDNQD